MNTDVAIVVECKSQPSIDDVNEHLERLDLFKTNFPQYTNFCIFGVNLVQIALTLPGDAKKESKYRRTQRFFSEIIINSEILARFIIA